MRIEESASQAGRAAATVGTPAERPTGGRGLLARGPITLASALFVAVVVALALVALNSTWPGSASPAPQAAQAPATTTTKPGMLLPGQGVTAPRATQAPATMTSPTSLAEKPAPAAIANVPQSCPITVPGSNGFSPPSQAPEGPPALYDSVWFGTPELWTMINPQGETRWPHGEKTFWWSENFSLMDELEPDIIVTAEHLDGTAPAVKAGGPGTNGSHPDLGNFMLVGLEIPESGCWKITAQYQGATLSYVVWADGG